mgnify:CR=1 FL=1
MRKLELKTQPYTDNKMKWDVDEQKYIVDKDYFEKRTGISLVELLGSENKAEAFLLSLSHRLYNIIYDSANSNDRSHNVKIKRLLMKHDTNYRQWITDALISFGRAAIDTDIDRVGDEWELQGQLINHTRDIDLPIDTHRILKASGLLTSARYNFDIEVV